MPSTTLPPGQPPVLLTRRQAAEALSMSLRHFERHVQPHLPVVPSGQLRLYRLLDLERWVQKHTTTRPLGTGVGS